MDGLSSEYRVETWLLDRGRIRRARAQKELTIAEFLEQRSPCVAYIVYRRQHGTYSDSQGGLACWKRVTKLPTPTDVP